MKRATKTDAAQAGPRPKRKFADTAYIVARFSATAVEQERRDAEAACERRCGARGAGPHFCFMTTEELIADPVRSPVEQACFDFLNALDDLVLAKLFVLHYVARGDTLHSDEWRRKASAVLVPGEREDVIDKLIYRSHSDMPAALSWARDRRIDLDRWPSDADRRWFEMTRRGR